MAMGGANDGKEFRMVKAQMDDGSVCWFWACNTMPGYFRQVFVPWDFQHHQIVEL